MLSRKNEFYVGYLGQSPPRIGIWTRRSVSAIFVVGLLVGLVVVSAQSSPDTGVFEFGIEKEFVGIVVERPHPLLIVPGDNEIGYKTYYLSSPGKFGAGSQLDQLDGRSVRITGSLIHNGFQQMIEVHRVSTLNAPSAVLAARRISERVQLGRIRLVGEIVDSKCHLGMMKPGRSKTHKACAILCISGGSPPLLRVEDWAGGLTYLLLVSESGESLGESVLPFVAEPVEITGEVVRYGDLLVLQADLEAIHRIPRDK